MNIPKIYLETSAINFFYADDSPEKQVETLLLFKEIKAGKWDAYTSYAVTKEIKAASKQTRKMLGRVIDKYNITILSANEKITKLANIYIKEGVIPQKHLLDAIHIAAASYYEMDIIISWNFQHIVKHKTKLMTNEINLRENYKTISISSPKEVIEYDAHKKRE